MKFAIIAAGEGSRLRAEGMKMPKGLVKINGLPMIERILKIAESFNPESISCIVNEESPELAEKIRETVKNCELNIVVKSTPSSMHSLYELKTYLMDDEFCLFTVDTVFFEEEFKKYIEAANSSKGYDGVMAVTEYIDDEKPLHVKCDDEMNIIAFLDESEEPKFISGGIYFFSPKVFDALDECISKNMFRLRNFQRMIIEKGFKLKAFKFSKIIDVDHIKDIKKAEELIRGLL